ncbi:MAG: BrnT family toxin [Verrucomicrobiae bacterium]|nr:BrnT family toxin [Verrucomicrobiae bacterium]
MEFDWLDVNFDLKKVTPREIAEAFEDPFAIRLLPDTDNDSAEVRFFSLAKTLNNRGLFSVFWTDGKNYRVILSREMTDDESTFYDRKNAEWL